MNVLLLIVALVSPVEAPKADMKEATAATAAVAAESVVPTAQLAKAAASPRIGAWAAAKSAAPCALLELYVRARFLSGPWSVTRRLEAARIRGDTEEAERLTAMLEEVFGEALEVEGTEP